MGLVNMVTRVGRNLLNVGRACELLDVVDPDSRVIEASVRDGALGSFLMGRGRGRYLGLVARGRGPKLANSDPALAERFLERTAAEDATRNNADVLVVQGRDSELLLDHHEYGHVEYILWGGGGGVQGVVAAAAGIALHVAHNHIEVAGTARLPGTRRRYLVLRNVKRTRWGARRYISPLPGLLAFFDELNRQEIDYVVLRWFETLPRLDPGEDVDLLVADEDVARLEQIFEREPGLIPCDVYTVSGLPGTSYQNMAYFPPPVARRILGSAVSLGTGIRVPAPREHLLSMAYHAVYHKDVKSGLPGSLIDPKESWKPDHDYAQVLTELAEGQGERIEATLEWLDEYLAAEGWRPPADTLARMSGTNPWLRARLEREREAFDREWEGLAVFLVRERAEESGYADQVVESIQDAGFHVLWNQALDPVAKTRVRESARGANWDRGPFATSGGSPARAIVAFDPRPTPPTAEDLDRHPGLDNRRLFVKERIRDAFNERLPEDQHCNVIHSSDNAYDAAQHLRLFCPHDVEGIRRRRLTTAPGSHPCRPPHPTPPRPRSQP